MGSSFDQLLATYVVHRSAQTNGGSTNTTGVAFHAVLLSSKHHYVITDAQRNMFTLCPE